MYRRFPAPRGWVATAAGLLIVATLACDERPSPTEPDPVDSEAPLRIVSLSPELSRLIVDFGLAPQIVGADSASHAIPELASALDLGGFEALDDSAIAASKPNFVFAVGAEDGIPVAAALRERGIPLYAFNPTSANEVIQSIQDLGIILDREEHARSAIRRLTREISKIATERDGKERLSVAWILQRDPLIVVGNRGMLHQMLELAGGEIALHQYEGERIEVSVEVLAASVPDLVLDSTPESRHEAILPGVRTGIPPMSASELPTLDLLGRIRTIHEILYPAK